MDGPSHGHNAHDAPEVHGAPEVHDDAHGAHGAPHAAAAWDALGDQVDAVDAYTKGAVPARTRLRLRLTLVDAKALVAMALQSTGGHEEDGSRWPVSMRQDANNAWWVDDDSMGWDAWCMGAMGM